MNKLPQDPIILLSYINTKLRDDYKSLDQLCDDLEVDKSQLIAQMAAIGYVYDLKLNKFV